MLAPVIVLGAMTLAIHPGQTLSVPGHVRQARAVTHVELAARTPAGRGWRVVAHAPLRRRHAFRLRWRIPAGTASPIELRVLALHRSRVLARSRPILDPLAKVVDCSPAASQPLAAGEGAITGGDYTEGGPAPGNRICDGDPYTETATDTATGATDTEDVPAGAGYFLMLPPGSYALKAGVCRGTATVTAGQVTDADTICAFP
jgi:hypothetical protein